MRFLRRRRPYTERVKAAEQEVRVSRKRLEQTTKDVVEPLREAKRHNQFAQIIRASLINGYQRKA